MKREASALLLLSDLKLFDYSLGVDLQLSPVGDIEITSNEMNLGQAISHRIRTVKGELAQLGHPEYGSTIFNYLGLPNTWATRERLRLAIRDAIRQEPRIKEIKSITVLPRYKRDSMNLEEDKVTPLMTDADVAKYLQTVVQIIQEKPQEGFSGSLGNIVDDERNGENIHGVPERQSTETATELLNSVEIEIIVVALGTNNAIKMSFPLNLEGA